MDIQSIKDLKNEAKTLGMNLDRVPIGKLLEWMGKKRDYYNDLITFTTSMFSENDKLTTSQFIRPFLEASARIVSEKALSDENPSS